MRIQRLQHVSTPYPPGAQDRIRAFYGDLLGLEEKAVPESLADAELVWYSAGEADYELHFVPEATWSEGQAVRHVCLESDDLEACRRMLAQAGYETRDATPIPNRPRFFCRDPFGHLIEFTAILGDYRPAS